MKPPLPPVLPCFVLLLGLPIAILAAAIPSPALSSSSFSPTLRVPPPPAAAPTATSDAIPPSAAALSSSSASPPLAQATDLLQESCFSTSSSLADYNAYGFRRYKQGTSLGKWVITHGEVDQYSAVVVSQSAAAGGVWLLPSTVPTSCTTLIDIDGPKPATITQTIPTVPGGKYRISFSFAGSVLPQVGGGPPPAHHGNPPPFKSLSVWWDEKKVGDVYINTLDTNAAGNSWDEATYDLVANTSQTTLSFSSTTKGGTGLALTDVHLFDLSAVPPPSSPSHHPSPLLSPAWRVRVLIFSLLSGLVLLGSLIMLFVHARGGLQWDNLPNWQRMDTEEGGGRGGGYNPLRPVSVGDSPFQFRKVVELHKRREEEGGGEEDEEVFFQRGVGGGGRVESTGMPSRFEGREEGYGSTRIGGEGGGGSWKMQL